MASGSLVTGIEFVEHPFYFRAESGEPKKKNSNETSVEEPESVLHYPETVNYSEVVFSCALMLPQDSGFELNRAEYAIRLAAVKDEIESTKLGAPNVKIWPMHQHFEGDGHTFRMGYFVQILQPTHRDSLQECLLQFARERNLEASFVDFDKDSDTVWLETVVESSGGATRGGLESRKRAIPLAPPACHPAFLRKENNSVFGSLTDVWNVLQKCPDLPGVSELKQIAQAELGDCLDTSDHVKASAPAEPFVVVEGLDGVGKTTLVQRLATILDAKIMKTPPDCLLPWRRIFDAHPSLLRRLFYCVGNYIVGKQIREICNTSPVIMDRFWNSTAAYTLAAECAGGDESVLPPSDHSVYRWPADLTRPNLVVLLSLGEHEREARLTNRVVSENVAKTNEEELMTRNKLFQRRIVEAYKRMADPSPVEVPGECSKDELVNRVKEQLQKAGIQL